MPAFAIVGLADKALNEARSASAAGSRSAELEFPRRAHHLEPRAGGASEGGFRLRPADRARVAGGVGQVPRDGSRARVAGRALARRTAARGRRRLVGAEGARRSGLERRSVRRSRCRGGVGRGRAWRRCGTSPRWSRISAASWSRRLLPPPNGSRPSGFVPDLTEVRGQQRARRALEIAAAGGHNLLLVGPPGTGKTMLARRLPRILPPLDAASPPSRRHESTRSPDSPRPRSARRDPPFRAPHHRCRRRPSSAGTRPAAGRGEPRASRGPLAGRAGGVRAAGARVAAAAAGGRQFGHGESCSTETARSLMGSNPALRYSKRPAQAGLLFSAAKTRGDFVPLPPRASARRPRPRSLRRG